MSTGIPVNHAVKAESFNIAGVAVNLLWMPHTFSIWIRRWFLCLYVCLVFRSTQLAPASLIDKQRWSFNGWRSPSRPSSHVSSTVLIHTLVEECSRQIETNSVPGMLSMGSCRVGGSSMTSTDVSVKTKKSPSSRLKRRTTFCKFIEAMEEGVCEIASESREGDCWELGSSGTGAECTEDEGAVVSSWSRSCPVPIWYALP